MSTHIEKVGTPPKIIIIIIIIEKPLACNILCKKEKKKGKKIHFSKGLYYFYPLKLIKITYDFLNRSGTRSSTMP